MTCLYNRVLINTKELYNIIINLEEARVRNHAISKLQVTQL